METWDILHVIQRGKAGKAKREQLTHSVAPSPAFEGRVKKRRSGSTLSPSAVLGALSLSKGKPQHL